MAGGSGERSPLTAQIIMRKIIAFYAWQSDTGQEFNRALIDRALREAAKRITDDHSLGIEVLVDSDTEGVPGIPPVTETILKKIQDCDIFVPDVTFVASSASGKRIPNPNVMLEFGYALRAITHAAIMPVMNTAFGPPEELPFDMGHLRHPIQYKVDATAKDSERRAVRETLRESKKNSAFRLQPGNHHRPLLLRFRWLKPKMYPLDFELLSNRSANDGTISRSSNF